MLPYYNCQEHPAQQYTNICIHSHSCNKRLCSDCVFNHKGIKKEMMLPEAVFKQKILTIIEEQEKQYPLNFYQKQKEEITKFFKGIEQQVQQTIKELKQQAENFINIFEEEAKYLDSLKNELKIKSIFDFPNIQIERMTQLINSTQLPINNEMRAKIFYEIPSGKQFIQKTISQMTQEILQSSSYIQLRVGKDKIIENSNYHLWFKGKQTMWQYMADDDDGYDI